MKSTRNLEIWRELEEKKYDNIFPLIDGSQNIFPKKNRKNCFLFEILRSGENLKKKSMTTFSPLIHYYLDSAWKESVNT